MPGLLKSDAWCPVCGRDIVAICRTTTHRFGNASVRLEFIHNPKEFNYEHSLMGKASQMDRIYDRLNASQRQDLTALETMRTKVGVLVSALDRLLGPRTCEWGGNVDGTDCLTSKRTKPCRTCQARDALDSSPA